MVKEVTGFLLSSQKLFPVKKQQICAIVDTSHVCWQKSSQDCGFAFMAVLVYQFRVV
jgi:hypothetical protein